ncbi:MAG TPA: CobD/CbiB family cobalamin biosynthesis protein [Azospirillaceae bacterium]|nr:CobD/CbiB family cobalamin biosynthesis protein [Azospirillaceae bacterium]
MLSPVLDSPQSLFILLLVLALEAAVGDMRLFARLVPGPWTIAYRLATWFDRRLNRIERSNVNRMIRGLLVTAVIVGLAAALGWAASRFAVTVRFGWALETVLVMTGLGFRPAWAAARTAAAALAAGQDDAARAAAQTLTFKNVYALDVHGVARVAVEGLAKAVNQRVVAPAFWYMLAGLPGVMAWTALDAVDAAIGHTSPRYAWFGLAAARLDDACNFLPARLSGLLLALAALFVPGARPLASLKTILTFAGRHRSMSGGWPESALAGAFGLSLSGPRREGEVVIKEAWIGGGRARVIATDVRKALALSALAVVLTGGLVALLALGLSL